MNVIDGIVTIVQETRFLLQTGQGEHHLFLLSHNAALEPAQLVPLQRRQARVRVGYETAPDLIALVARSITCLDARKENGA